VVCGSLLHRFHALPGEHTKKGTIWGGEGPVTRMSQLFGGAKNGRYSCDVGGNEGDTLKKGTNNRA